MLCLSCRYSFDGGGIQWSETDIFNINDYVQFTKKTGVDFHILQLTDVHLGDNAGDDEKAFAMIRGAVDAAKPDLLLLSGDNVRIGYNYAPGIRLVAFLDGFETPYAMVLGNHDREGVFNDIKIGDVYAAGRHSLFTRGPINIPGCGNYGVNLVNESGEVIYALVMIDSNNRRNLTEYDCIYPQQIAWYEWYINGISDARYGDERTPDIVVKSLVCFHIPLPEINDIREYLKTADPALEEFAFRETPCPSKVNTGMFQKIKDLRSTTYIFNGHDHKNLLDYEWEGVHFVYGLKTGPCSYHDNDRMGTTLISIKDDLTVQVEFLYAGE